MALSVSEIERKRWEWWNSLIPCTYAQIEAYNSSISLSRKKISVTPFKVSTEETFKTEIQEKDNYTTDEEFKSEAPSSPQYPEASPIQENPHKFSVSPMKTPPNKAAHIKNTFSIVDLTDDDEDDYVFEVKKKAYSPPPPPVKKVQPVQHKNASSATSIESKYAPRKQNHIPKIEPEEEATLGFYNHYGKTCYFNSAIQCLFAMKPFTQEVVHFLYSNITSKHLSELEREFIETFHDLFIRVGKGYKKDGEFFITEEHNNFFWVIGRTPHGEGFNDTEQNDSSSILEHILAYINGLMMKLNTTVSESLPIYTNNVSERVEFLALDAEARGEFMADRTRFDTSFFSALGVCTLKKYECELNQHQSEKLELGNIIPLVAAVGGKGRPDYQPYGTIENSLAAYFGDGEVEKKCGQCPSNKATYTQNVVQLPEFLILSINNFQKQNVKVSDPLEFGEQLDLNYYLDVSVMGFESGLYNLMSFTCYYSKSGKDGHYKAVVKAGTDSNGESRWISFNDTDVRVESDANFEADKRAAHVLIYKKVKIM